MAVLLQYRGQIGKEPVGNRRRHARKRQYQANERSLSGCRATGVAYGPAGLFTRRGLHALALAHGFLPGMNNNRLGLYGLFVKVDLETQSWKGLAGPCDGFAISEQAQHAQIELSVDGLALALGIAQFDGDRKSVG